MNTWKDSIHFIGQHAALISVMCLLFVLPIQLVYWLGSSMFPLFFDLRIATVHTWLLFLVCFVLSQIPFILIVQQIEESGEVSIIRFLRTIVDYFWSIGLRFSLFFLLIYPGLHLFIIPGALLFVVMLFLPQALYLEPKNWKVGIRTAWDLGFHYLGKNIMLFVSALSVLKLFQDGSTYVLSLYAGGHPLAMLVPPLLGTLVFPLYTIYVTFLYLDGKEEIRISRTKLEDKESNAYVIR
ncbi:hypothetical protein [Shimazuella kribbensis]|uniref:hypothetical protein n=1 Tax=Shimazuella kribbensis TaxID=139808 RepID=UPI000427F961|nr:hypothetical protein [Shimazuella kribbensis]